MKKVFVAYIPSVIGRGAILGNGLYVCWLNLQHKGSELPLCNQTDVEDTVLLLPLSAINKYLLIDLLFHDLNISGGGMSFQ